MGNALSTSNQAVLDEFLNLPWARHSFANSYQVDVEQMTLTTFLSDRGIEDLNMLVVDVEGNEPAVFAGFDLERWRPTMMIVELADTHRDLVANRLEHEQVGRDIVEAKYRVVYKDATNTRVRLLASMAVTVLSTNASENGQLNTTGGTTTQRALITGIGGQDGSLLAELLVNEGYEVCGVVRDESVV